MNITMKKFLSKSFELDKQIKKLAEQIEILKNRQLSPISAARGLGIQKSKNITASEDLTIKVLTLEGELCLLKQEILALESQIRHLTLNLPPIQRAIIIWRYICRFIWKDIAKKAAMSEMQLMREHNEAIGKMSKDRGQGLEMPAAG
jgi:DNA-directed RNA polymerase specialized sigma subunit